MGNPVTLPRLPLPHERPLVLLREDRQVRLLTELLIAVLCIPLGMFAVLLMRGGAYDPDGTTLLATAIGLAPLVFFASLRPPSTYLLTTHRIAEIKDETILWSVRREQISRIRRIGGTLHLRGVGKLTYSVQNIRYVHWLDRTLREHARP